MPPKNVKVPAPFANAFYCKYGMLRTALLCYVMLKTPTRASLSGAGVISWSVLDMVIMAIYLDVVMWDISILAQLPCWLCMV